jgi:MFS family permease
MPDTSTAERWLPVAAAVSVAGWGANQFAPLAMVYRFQEGWPALTVAGMFTIYVVGLVPGLLVAGRVANRYGRRRVVRSVLVVSATASVLLATAPMSELVVFPSRLVTGLTSGLLLSAGATWLLELSAASGHGVGARRAMYATGGGFAAGALTAGVVAEWLPHPMVLPCLVHALLALLVWVATRRTPETAVRRRRASAPAVDPDLRRAAVQHPRFLRVVLPASPAVFEAATVAYVVLPPLVIGQVAGYAPLFSGLVAAVAISMGLVVQPVADWLDHPGSARSTLVAMATVIVGLLAGAAAVHEVSALMVLVAAVILGAGYGLTLAAGLKEIERLAPPQALGTASSLYQGVTYSGFFAPLLLAVTASAAAYPLLLAGMAGVGLLFLVLTAAYSRRHLPDAAAAPESDRQQRASLERSAPWAE